MPDSIYLSPLRHIDIVWKEKKLSNWDTNISDKMCGFLINGYYIIYNISLLSVMSLSWYLAFIFESPCRYESFLIFSFYIWTSMFPRKLPGSINQKAYYNHYIASVYHNIQNRKVKRGKCWFARPCLIRKYKLLNEHGWKGVQHYYILLHRSINKAMSEKYFVTVCSERLWYFGYIYWYY